MPLISIHVLRAEDDLCRDFCAAAGMISIHVLRAEDDLSVTELFCHIFINFNPRPPCGGRLITPNQIIILVKFQSTSSVRRTTAWLSCTDVGAPISIHVLRAEDDVPDTSRQPITFIFQSTSSVRRTTFCRDCKGVCFHISIHVLRAEDDGKNREKSLFALI